MKAEEVNRGHLTLAIRQHIADLGITRADIERMVWNAINAKVDAAFGNLTNLMSKRLDEEKVLQHVTTKFLNAQGASVAHEVARDISKRLSLKDPADSFSKPPADTGKW